MDARKHRQFAHLTRNRSGHHHLMHLPKHFFHVHFRFPLRKFGEQRRRRLGNAATRTDKTDVLDPVAVERQEQFQLVAAQRIMSLGGTRCLRHFVEIPRLLAVIKNDLLVKVVDVFEHGQLME